MSRSTARGPWSLDTSSSFRVSSVVCSPRPSTTSGPHALGAQPPARRSDHTSIDCVLVVRCLLDRGTRRSGFQRIAVIPNHVEKLVPCAGGRPTASAATRLRVDRVTETKDPAIVTMAAAEPRTAATVHPATACCKRSSGWFSDLSVNADQADSSR